MFFCSCKAYWLGETRTPTIDALRSPQLSGESGHGVLTSCLAIGDCLALPLSYSNTITCGVLPPFQLHSQALNVPPRSIGLWLGSIHIPRASLVVCQRTVELAAPSGGVRLDVVRAPKGRPRIYYAASHARRPKGTLAQRRELHYPVPSTAIF